MPNYQYISAGHIVNQVVRMLGVQEQINWQDWFEWIGEAVEFIGANPAFIDKVACLNVKNHQAELPCDLHAIVQTEAFGQAMRYGTDTRQSHYHTSDSKDLYYPRNQVTNTYSINAGYLNASFREGEVKLYYKAFPLDKEGFPLVPKLQSVKTAIAWYIIQSMLLQGYPHKVITYEYAETQWQWYCGQAKGDLNLPDLTEAISIGKSLSRLVPQLNLDLGFYSNQGSTDIVFEPNRL